MCVRVCTCVCVCVCIQWMIDEPPGWENPLSSENRKMAGEAEGKTAGEAEGQEYEDFPFPNNF